MLKSHRYVVHRRVMVNLKSGNAIAGVIVRQSGPLLVLKDAQLHEPGATGQVPIDGEAIVAIADVDFIQAT